MPEKPVVMTASPNQVITSVLVKVNEEDRATGVRQGEILVPLPWLSERILGRTFVPTLHEDDILVTVPVDVPKALAMPVAGLRDH